MSKRFTHITQNDFSLTTPLHVDNIKVLGEIDTESKVTIISKVYFLDKSKLH